MSGSDLIASKYRLIYKRKRNGTNLNMTTVLLTCVPERNHQGQTEDDVNRETPGHLSVGHFLPFSVFPNSEPPHVPVFKWRGKIET